MNWQQEAANWKAAEARQASRVRELEAELAAAREEAERLRGRVKEVQDAADKRNAELASYKARHEADHRIAREVLEGWPIGYKGGEQDAVVRLLEERDAARKGWSLLLSSEPLLGRVERLEGENAALRGQLDAAQRREGAVRTLLLRVLPECFVCPDCGPMVGADEDGCCAACGADLETMPTEQALAPPPAAPGQQACPACGGKGSFWMSGQESTDRATEYTCAACGGTGGRA